MSARIGHKRKLPDTHSRKRVRRFMDEAQPYDRHPEPRYAHLVEEDVHPYQALCGWEWDGTQVGPEPMMCPKCTEIYKQITDPKEIVR